MAYARTNILLQRAVEMELDFCRSVNRALQLPVIRPFFSTVSRLGDGVFWYGLIIAIPFIYGVEAMIVSLLMATVGAANLAIYKVIKKATCRERPCATSDDIIPGTHLLDHYSFPSGHTLHAVSFTIMAVTFFPVLGWVLIPFAILIAVSRVILGLHYPTDVVAGAFIGSTTSLVGLSFIQI